MPHLLEVLAHFFFYGRQFFRGELSVRRPPLGEDIIFDLWLGPGSSDGDPGVIAELKH